MITYTLLSPLLAMVLAQAIKIPIYFFISKKWMWSLFFSTGGMPSSHTATVIALTTAVGMAEGWDSNLFVICLVFSAIVMHDATGVRRHAGYHAQILNQLLHDFNQLLVSLKKSSSGELNHYQRRKLKEILGHKPIEVFCGALFGAAIALAIYPFYFAE
jgi:acid phosphatase family membrane protein YuiD